MPLPFPCPGGRGGVSFASPLTPPPRLRSPGDLASPAAGQLPRPQRSQGPPEPHGLSATRPGFPLAWAGLGRPLLVTAGKPATRAPCLLAEPEEVLTTV